jgi:type I restriction enzyme M protein
MTKGDNKFCNIKNLKNESDVEQNFLINVLDDLGFTEDYRETKGSIKSEKIGKGKNRREYTPDYVCYLDTLHKKPVLIIDAKHPDVSPLEGATDSQMYASIIRRGLLKPKPDQFCIGSNGIETIVKHYDSNAILYELEFNEFKDDNKKYTAFKSGLTREHLSEDFIRTTEAQFEFEKPDISDLISIFEACHNLIWKKEKIPPAEAFYEFAKLLFVKLRKDRDIHKKIASGQVTLKDFEFSVAWIESLESATPNPIDTILFARLRDDLEEEISKGTKKRMFDVGESIRLSPATIKEVVKLLEHRDLNAIDEDLNGRMFETFLTAVIRGRGLGQFFTPRSVVKFMVDIANPTVSKKDVPRIIDACCGTGGFLIEAMARLTDSIKNNRSLSPDDKIQLQKQVLQESLWGLEANGTIARIARINMYLHQDGGSRIYHTDSLDKDLMPDHELVGEVKRDFQELKTSVIENKTEFHIALTNPPFAMHYESKKKDEKRILEQYSLAKPKGKLMASLRSSVMFIERYYDLLKSDGGMLLTIIDDSVLNTTTFSPVRDWIKKRFYIRAVISLPKNCFVVSGSASKTSILVLEKKSEVSDDQTSIFMAKSKNVGHSDSGKPDLNASDLPAILVEWNRFSSTGTPPTRKGCFILESEKIENRLDIQWYDPEYLNLYRELEKVPHTRIGDLDHTLKYGASLDADYMGDIPFIRIENLRRNDIDLSDLQSIPSALYLNEVKLLFLKEGDILIARSGTYVGLCAAVGRGFEKFIYGSYIIRLRIENSNVFIPKFIAIYLNSRFGQMQFDRLKTGSLQFNINIQHINDVIIPIISKSEQEKIISDFEKRHTKIKTTKHLVEILENELSEVLVSNITTSSKIKGKLSLRNFTGE